MHLSDQFEKKQMGQRAGARLLSYHDVPSWQQSNEYLLSGYRSPSGCIKISLGSVLYLNNETVNIYSHFLGALVFMVLPRYFYDAFYLPACTAEPIDLAVLSIYLRGVATCFFLSAVYHTFDNHSPGYSSFLNHLDYLGIVVLMWGASIPTIHYGFYEDAFLKYTYWSTTSFLAVACATFTLHPAFRSPKFRVYRTSLYVTFGLSGIVFVIHGIVLHGWGIQNQRMSLSWMLWMTIANLTGAVLFVARFPERCVPYRFDIFGSSHQLLHVAVLIAAAIHFIGLLSAFNHIHPSTVLC